MSIGKFLALLILIAFSINCVTLWPVLKLKTRFNSAAWLFVSVAIITGFISNGVRVFIIGTVFKYLYLGLTRNAFILLGILILVESICWLIGFIILERDWKLLEKWIARNDKKNRT